MLGAEAREQPARAGRADLLVAVDEDGDRAEVAEAEAPQHRERVQDHRDPLLVVGDAQPVRLVAVDPEGLPLGHAPEVDGVHVRDQQDLARARAPEGRAHGLSDALRRVPHAVHAGAHVDELDLAPERPQAAGDEVGEPGEAFQVAAAQLDGDELLQRVEEGSRLAPGRREDRLLRLGENGCRRGKGNREDGRGHRKGQRPLPSCAHRRSPEELPRRGGEPKSRASRPRPEIRDKVGRGGAHGGDDCAGARLTAPWTEGELPRCEPQAARRMSCWALSAVARSTAWARCVPSSLSVSASLQRRFTTDMTVSTSAGRRSGRLPCRGRRAAAPSPAAAGSWRRRGLNGASSPGCGWPGCGCWCRWSRSSGGGWARCRTRRRPGAGRRARGLLSTNSVVLQRLPRVANGRGRRQVRRRPATARRRSWPAPACRVRRCSEPAPS